jgi:lipopolysaccharide export system permease protein
MILHLYFARRFAFSFVRVFGLFLIILILLDLIDQLRKFSSVDAKLGDVVSLSLLSAPGTIYKVLPLIVVLATIALFLALARSSEMVVTRAAGRSAMRALMAPAAVTLIIGGIAVAVLNPLVAATSKQYEVRAGALKGQTNILALSSDGFWLRQGSANGQTVIHARATNLDGTKLSDVSFITFTVAGGPVRRIEAATAELKVGAWTLTDAKVWTLAGTPNPEAGAQRLATIEVSSTLTPDQIRDSFSTPSSIPIWELPGFIARLQTAGFSALRHQVWYQTELAQPAFLIAMVLIGAVFTMRHQRGGRTGIMVLAAVLLSFGLYFIRNFALILGENGQIPVLLAAWAPPLSAIGLSLGLLLHLEDG